jgi:general secretion pathway protein D
MAVCLLAGCELTSLGEQRPRLPDPFDTVQNTDLNPRSPTQVGEPSTAARPTPSQSYYGREPGAREAGPAAVPGQAVQSGDGFELNFENTAVATVAKVILGDILGLGYTIDPRVQGTVTIASGRPVPKRDLLLVLESALRMSNVVLVKDGGAGYRLIPGSDGQSAPALARVNDPEGGYGISVVPLHYTSAATILKLLDSFAIRPGMARADPGLNLILVEGTGPERKSAVESILTFDVDWMRGQSVGIYPLQNASPEEMIKELGTIIENGDGGLSNTLVTLQPVSRLNAVLVVSKKPALLRETAIWIRRLDKANNGGASVHVYRLHYGDAREIAKVLSELFGSRSSGLDSAANQIAPGAPVAAQSSNIFPGAAGNQGLPGLATIAGSSNSSAGIQLGNMGNGLGNTRNLAGPNATGTSPNIESGAFGNRGAPGQPGIVLPGFRIAADVTNNSLVIYASGENYRLIQKTLSQLDRPQLQVAIHATIAEVTLNNDLQFGVEYFLQGTNATAGLNTIGASTAIAAGTTPSMMLSAVLPGGNLLLGPQANPKVVINALRNITDVKVLSSPSVVVLDNQLATLLVGDQVPVETQSATILTNPNTPLVNSINYINTGVILRVLPRININGNVILDVEQEVSGVANNANAATLTPTVSQRQIKSAISVASGQTVLLGGLISETQQRTRSGIPLLEEIPGVGNLFSTNDRSTQRTEIIIFIEPQIIRNSVDAAHVAEELRAKLRGSANAAFQPGPSLFGNPRFAQ